MKSSKRVSINLLWVSVLLLIPVVAAALATKPSAPAPAYHPSAPAYHPSAPAYHPSAPAYHPSAPAYHPSAPAYHPSAPAYHPAPSAPAYHPAPSSPSYHPAPSAPVHSYTPGAPSGGNTTSPHTSSGVTTYTPHTYTPGASSASHPSGSTSVSGGGVTNNNGVTTYTPHASSGSTSYTPSAPPATHVNTYTPGAPASAGGSTFTPHNNSPINSAGGGGTHAVYSIPASGHSGGPGAGPSTLTPAGSQSVLHQLNTARGGLGGVNNKPIPSGQVVVHPNQSLTVNASNGRNYNLRSNGTLASYSGHDQAATFRDNGHLASVHTSNMDIARGPHGQRSIVSERPDHGRLVSTGKNRGYIEHPVSYHGHDYTQRTYVHGDHRFTREYSHYNFHGREFNHYVPRYSYAPAFYGWAYYPWGAPVPYGWGWEGSPWFDFYAGFFSPWGSYPDGASWLTDFLFGQTLQDGYPADAQAGGTGQPYSGNGPQDADAQDSDDQTSAPADTPITPAIKQLIAEEVKQQLAFENAAAAKPDQAPTLDGLPQVLVPNHLFVVDQVQNVNTADGQQCSLSAGDVIKLAAAPPDGAATADLAVLSSRKGDCASGLTVTVPLESLQEMQNNFRAQLDSGLQALRDQQGKGGLPAAPISAITPPPVPADEPPADTENVQADLNAQQQQADQAETSVTQTAFAATPPTQ